jgi:hypothetical protein
VRKIEMEMRLAWGDAIILLSSQKSVNVSGNEYNISSDDKLNVTATVIRWAD